MLPPAGAIVVKLLVADLSGEQVEELIAVHRAGEAQRLRARALPFGRRKPALGIIIVGLIIAAGLRRTCQRRYGCHHQTGPWLMGVGEDGGDDDGGGAACAARCQSMKIGRASCRARVCRYVEISVDAV